MEGMASTRFRWILIIIGLLIPSCRKPADRAILSLGNRRVPNDTPEQIPHADARSLYPRIEVDIGVMWDLRIFQDGSGSVGFGSSLDDQADFPTGTFSFDNVASDLRKTLSDEPLHNRCSVGIINSSKSEVVEMHSVNDVSFVLSLFERAHRAIRYESGSLRKVWADSSPDNPASMQQNG